MNSMYNPLSFEAEAPPRLDFWQRLLSPRLVAVVDVGAMPTRENYHLLLRQGLAEVVAFEPNRSGCEALNAVSPQLRCYPWVIGTGERRRFHLNAMIQTSSIYPSNLELLSCFYPDAGPFLTREIIEVETRRLDELGEIRACDLLKMDVQGAEIEVLSGAQDLLAEVMLVQTEVCFVPFYHGQPLFGDLDLALRQQGFLFHSFVNGAVEREAWLNRLQPLPQSQMLFADALYLRLPTRLAEHPPEKLLKMALLLDLCFQAPDAAARALEVYDRLTGAGLLPAFIQSDTQPAG